jgi:O-antigen ligase
MVGKFELLTLKQLFGVKTKVRIASLILLFFLLTENISIVLITLFGVDFADAVQNGFLLFLILLYYIFLYKERSKKTSVWPIYIFIVLFILIAVLFYPEYDYWLFHELYGINAKYFRLYSGVFALLYVSMVDNKARIASLFIYSARINFLFYIIQFFHALRRGYWISAYGTQINYNLAFGYRVAIVASLFLILYVFSGKKSDLISFLISLIMIILQGSRGALGCIVSTSFFLALYCLPTSKQIVKKKIGKIVVSFVLLISLFGAFIVGVSLYDNSFIDKAATRAVRYSRTAQLLWEGNIDDGSGREGIWSVAIEAIQESDVFGYGFYGDRHIVGRKLIFGYPHNFVLEVLLQFGVPIGIFLILLLFWNIIKMGRECNDITWLFIYIFLLSSCSKLLLSDSFWYYWPFWALIGVLCVWKRQIIEVQRQI